jgi:DNA-directed RNA polymerase subunit RPC12/RpoP
LRSGLNTMENSITSKTCSRCKQIKPLSDFNKGKDTKLGYQSACKECESLRRKDYRKYNTFKCEECGSEFQRRSDYKKTDNKYCPKCSSKILGKKREGQILEKARKGKYVICDNCGKKHYKKLSQIKRGYTHNFCGSKCQGEWSAKHFVPNKFIKSADNAGSKNGRYKHGKRIGAHDRHKELREQIKKRDGEGCLICKSKDKIHVHRILPGALGGKYTSNNTVMLCSIHHAAVHRDYEVWMDKLINMINGDIA